MTSAYARLFLFAAAAANAGTAAGTAAHGRLSVSATLHFRAVAGMEVSATTAGRASRATVTLTSRAPHASIALSTGRGAPNAGVALRTCRGARTAMRLDTASAARRAGVYSDAIAAMAAIPIAVLVMPTLIRSVAPAVPAVHAAPADTLAPCRKPRSSFLRRWPG